MLNDSIALRLNIFHDHRLNTSKILIYCLHYLSNFNYDLIKLCTYIKIYLWIIVFRFNGSLVTWSHFRSVLKRFYNREYLKCFSFTGSNVIFARIRSMRSIKLSQTQWRMQDFTIGEALKNKCSKDKKKHRIENVIINSRIPRLKNTSVLLDVKKN